MRVTRMLPMCGAAPAAPDIEVLEDDLTLRDALGRSSDADRRLCTISDDVSACNYHQQHQHSLKIVIFYAFILLNGRICLHSVLDQPGSQLVHERT